MERRRDVSCPVALRAAEHCVHACVFLWQKYCGLRSTLCAVIHVYRRKGKSDSLKARCSEGTKGHFSHSTLQQKPQTKTQKTKNNKLSACIHDEGEKMKRKIYLWPSGLKCSHACLCCNVETGFRCQAGYQALTQCLGLSSLPVCHYVISSSPRGNLTGLIPFLLIPGRTERGKGFQDDVKVVFRRSN